MEDDLAQVQEKLKKFMLILDYYANFFLGLEKSSLGNVDIDLFIQEKAKEFFYDNLYEFYKYSKEADINSEEDKKLLEIKVLYYHLTSKLYHYTAFDSLQKIINSATFKLSNIKKMNDEKEGMILCDFLKQKYSKTYKDGNAEKSYKARELINESIKEVDDCLSNIFSFSLSLSDDDAAQWERYGLSKNKRNVEGDINFGVCLEISHYELAKQLLNVCNEMKQKSDDIYEVVEITPVLYAAENNINLDIVFLCVLSEFYKEIGENTKIPADTDKEDLILKKKLAEYIARYSCDIKDKSFQSEREIRIVVESSKDKNKDSIYLRLDMNKIIKSVKIQPNLKKYNLSENDAIKRVEDLLRKNNIQAPVCLSKCPLRT